jgi:hypothetical protein
MFKKDLPYLFIFNKLHYLGTLNWKVFGNI